MTEEADYKELKERARISHKTIRKNLEATEIFYRIINYQPHDKSL